MSELVAFLEARLADDEAVARDGLHTSDCTRLDNGDDDSWCMCDYGARVLREVTAQRAILAKYERAQAAYRQMMNPASTAAVFALAEVVQHMASVYEDHPDFQEQWR